MRMFSFLKKVWRDKRGNAIVIAAAALPVIVGCAGLATDTIQWTLWKRQLQRAADSAALSGVYTRLQDDSQSSVEGAVDHDLTLNLHTWMPLNADPKVELLGDDGNSTDPVRVTLRIQQGLPFSSMFMSAAPTIEAVATAASVPGGGEYCVIGLDRSTTAVGIDIAGSTNLDMGSCSLIADSANPTNAANNGTASKNGGAGSSITAASIAAAGGVNYSKSWNVDEYDPYTTPIDDPYADLANHIPKSTSDCTKQITIAKKNFPMDRTQTGTNLDTAGSTVCINGGLTVQGSLKLQSGVTYVINGGNLTMNTTGASLSCDGCTIILTNFTNPALTGNIQLTGGTLDISAPTADGTWKGIALYQDGRATDTGKKTQNQINGNNGTSVEGVIYVPNQSLLYNGGSSTSAACLQIVVKRAEFSGNSAMQTLNDCPDFGFKGGSSRRVRLVA
jgi:hypothetical protein